MTKVEAEKILPVDKSMTFSKIPYASGSSKRGYLAKNSELVNLFVITKFGDFWTIAHYNTGIRLLNCPTLVKAKGAARKMHEIADWRFANGLPFSWEELNRIIATVRPFRTN